MASKVKIPSVLCVGNFAWADVKKSNKKITRLPGGMAFRFVLACSFFSVPVDYITVLGGEKEWLEIVKILEENQARGVRIKKVDKSIIFSWEYSKKNKLVSLRMKNEENMDLIPSLVKSKVLANYRIVNVCSLGIKNEKKIINTAKQSNKLISYIFHESNIENTSPKEYLKMFKYVDFLFLNKKESFLLTGERKCYKAGLKLSALAQNVFITNGKKGALFFKKKRLVKNLKALKTRIKDASGAGDTFAGGVMAGFLLTGKMQTACRFGIIAASLSLEDYLTNSLYQLLN